MMYRIFLLSGIVLMSAMADGQQMAITDALGADSTLLDEEWKSWSLRVFTTYKSYRYRVVSKESDRQLLFQPNNNASMGLGITYKFISFDLGLNLKSRDEIRTKRFDANVTFAFDRNIIEIGYQRYKGFEVSNDLNQNYDFRTDLRSQLFGFNFYRTSPGRQLSLRAIANGMQVQKKSAFLLTYGGYWFWDQIKGDSSIIPVSEAENFASRAQIDFSSQFSFGGVVGGVYSLVLPFDLFLFTAVSPGLGFNTAKLEADQRYSSPLFPAVRLNLRAAFGYAGPKMYVVLSFASDFNYVPWGDQQRYRYAHTRTKLSVGYRLSSQIPFLEKISQKLQQHTQF